MLSFAADAPTAADWLEAWATLVAAILSAAALFVALWVLRRDQRVRREDKLEADTARASLIVARPTNPLGSPGEGWTGLQLAVINNSNAEISNLTVTIWPREYRAAPALAGKIKSLPGGAKDSVESTFVLPQPWPFAVGETSLTEMTWHAKFGISFIDSTGLRWERSGNDPPYRVRGLSRDRGLISLLAEYVWILPAFNTTATFIFGRRQAMALWLADRIGTRNHQRFQREQAQLLPSLELLRKSSDPVPPSTKRPQHQDVSKR